MENSQKKSQHHTLIMHKLLRILISIKIVNVLAMNDIKVSYNN